MLLIVTTGPLRSAWTQKGSACTQLEPKDTVNGGNYVLPAMPKDSACTPLGPIVPSVPIVLTGTDLVCKQSLCKSVEEEDCLNSWPRKYKLMIDCFQFQ